MTISRFGAQDARGVVAGFCGQAIVDELARAPDIGAPGRTRPWPTQAAFLALTAPMWPAWTAR